jgi:hypothetical protein
MLQRARGASAAPAVLPAEKPIIPAAPLPEVDDVRSTVWQLQSQLSALGLYRNEIDGWGAGGTQRALSDFVTAHPGRLVKAAAAVFVLGLLLPSIARAADAGAVPAAAAIDFTTILNTIVAGVFSVLGIWLTLFVQSHVKDQAAGVTVAAAVKNSLGALQQAAQAGIAQADPRLAIPGVGPALASGVQYVLDHAGPEAARLGITPVAIADKISAQIGLSNIATNLAVSSSTSPLVAKPLDPVPAATPVPAVIIPAT